MSSGGKYLVSLCQEDLPEAVGTVRQDLSCWLTHSVPYGLPLLANVGPREPCSSSKAWDVDKQSQRSPVRPGSVITAVLVQQQGIGGPEHWRHFPRNLEVVQGHVEMNTWLSGCRLSWMSPLQRTAFKSREKGSGQGSAFSLQSSTMTLLGLWSWAVSSEKCRASEGLDFPWVLASLEYLTKAAEALPRTICVS